MAVLYSATPGVRSLNSYLQETLDAEEANIWRFVKAANPGGPTPTVASDMMALWSQQQSWIHGEPSNGANVDIATAIAVLSDFQNQYQQFIYGTTWQGVALIQYMIGKATPTAGVDAGQQSASGTNAAPGGPASVGQILTAAPSTPPAWAVAMQATLDRIAAKLGA